MTLRDLGLGLILALLVACAPARDAASPVPSAVAAQDSAHEAAGSTPTPSGKTPSGADGKVDYTCATDADCTVKDVGNCCGYYPACVNVDSPTFPEQVKAACAESGTAGICGFPSISGCQCVENRCKAITKLLRDSES